MKRLIVLGGLLFTLMGCTTAEPAVPPTAVSATVPPVSAASPTTGHYYLLNESPPMIVEVNSQTLQEVRTFTLDGITHPEGIAFVPNVDVAQYGLFGLPPATNGGYFLIAIQPDATVHVFDVPLLGAGNGRASALMVLDVKGLKEDASDLYYHDGQLWLLASTERKVYQLGLTAEDGRIPTIESYKFKDLDKDLGDMEGMTFDPNGLFYMADDLGKTMYRFDFFPACTATDCDPAWTKYEAQLEPSGLLWDARLQKLLIVDDEGQIFSMDEDGQNGTIILDTSYDLEGITAIWPSE